MKTISENIQELIKVIADEHIDKLRSDLISHRDRRHDEIQKCIKLILGKKFNEAIGICDNNRLDVRGYVNCFEFQFGNDGSRRQVFLLVKNGFVSDAWLIKEVKSWKERIEE